MRHLTRSILASEVKRGGGYRKHLWLFAYCQSAVHDLHHANNLDFALSEYISHCWADGVPYRTALDAKRRYGGSSHG